MVKRTVDINKITNYYKHEYKNFKEDLFLADFSIQNWLNLENQNIDSCEKFNDFLWRVNCCVNRHAPMKRLRKKSN